MQPIQKSYLIPSIAQLIFCAIFLALALGTGTDLLADGDTGYHIRAGQYIISTLSVPKYDIFSFHTPPLPWTAHEWLSEVAMALVHDRFGLTGVVVFFAGLLAGTVSLLFVTLRADGTNLLLATAVTMLAFCASQIHWLARPHVFSFLLMLIWHRLLESWQRGNDNRLYLLPLTMLLWVNLHGGFLGGFLLLGAYLAGNMFELCTDPATERGAATKRIGQLVALAGASLLACLCNPSGYHILLFPFKLVGNRYLMDHVSEFLSPNFHEFLPFKYLLLLLIALVAASRKTVRASELFLVLMFTSMALYSTRYIPLFALITAPVLTRHWCWDGEAAAPLADFFRRRAATLAQSDARSAGYCWPVAALIAVALAAGSGSLKHSFDPKLKAVAATEFLMRESIRGNMFNDDEFGDYLIYRAFPRYRVFFDGRSDMYGAGKLREYYAIANFEPGWEQVLSRYGIGWIFYGTNSSLARFLLKDANWVLVYSDPVASIFVKDLPQYRQLIGRNRLAQLASAPPIGGAP